MEWHNLLSASRLCAGDEQGDGIRTEYYRDFDRVVFSAPFRRLARKTQVHPLSFNDHIHNRLTHSIEVSSVGRSLGLSVAQKIRDKLPQEITNVDFASIIQAACVAHDIGNPPFGHAGEFAIRQWFTENIDLLNNSLSEAQLTDLKLFEGNAQGFRIVSQLENHSNNGGLRLTHATLGSLLKYPWHSNHQLAAEKEKFNVFQSESNYFLEIVNKLGLAQKSDGTYARHPLSYLMEAADDICYKILDIEDALELNILRMEDVKDVFVRLSDDAPLVDLGKDFPARKRFAPFRAKAIDNLIREVVTVFEDNYMEIMSGNYDGDLISNVSSDCKESLKKIKEITSKDIFSYRRKIELEVGSYSSIEILLSAFVSAINEKIEKGENISFKSKRILDLMFDDLPKGQCSPYEYYMAITDFVSGMTDNYATFIAKQISGSAK